MNKLFLSAIFSLLCCPVYAQQFKWAASSNGIVDGTSDKAGNAYAVGILPSGTYDYDPGAGVFNLSFMSVQGEISFVVLKLDANGNFAWAKQGAINIGSDKFNIAVDDSSNVYVTGSCVNLGMGMNNYIGAGQFVMKMQSNGTVAWVRILPLQNDYYRGKKGLRTDAACNVYVTGKTAGGDIDSGPGTVMVGAGTFTVKLNNTGNIVWAAEEGGIALCTDNAGNTYTTETIFDSNNPVGTRIAKLDNLGALIWSRNIDSVISTDITTDEAGRLYLSGHFTGTTDFDPGPGTFNLSSAGNSDICLVKLDSAGQFDWAQRTGGPALDSAAALLSDNKGELYLVGSFIGTVDFDPGAGTSNLVSDTADIFIQKLDTSGAFTWAKRIGSYDIDRCYSVSMDSSEHFYFTGFANDADLNPGTPIYALPTWNSFVMKWADTTPVINHVQSVSNAFNVTVSPNPSEKTINIISDATIDILTVTDIIGRNVLTARPEQRSYSIDIETPGLYFININSRDKVLSKKVLISE